MLQSPMKNLKPPNLLGRPCVTYLTLLKLRLIYGCLSANVKRLSESADYFFDELDFTRANFLLIDSGLELDLRCDIRVVRIE